MALRMADSRLGSRPSPLTEPSHAVHALNIPVFLACRGDRRDLRDQPLVLVTRVNWDIKALLGKIAFGVLVLLVLVGLLVLWAASSMFV